MTYANETRIRNWRVMRLRGALATLSSESFHGGWRQPGLPDDLNSTRWADQALDAARASLLTALQVHEATQHLEHRYRAYRLSLWRPGDHPDCPIERLPDEVAVHSTMRLGDAWAQVVRRADKSYTYRFSFLSLPAAVDSYRRPAEAQLAAAHRVLRYFAWWRRLKARPDVVAFRAREAATGWTATVTTWQMTEGGAIIAFASKPLDYYGHGTAP